MRFKASKYNILVENEDSLICFNSTNGALFSVPKSLSGLLREALKENKFEKLQEKYKEIYEILIKGKFIIPIDFDEIKFINFRRHRDIFLNKNYRLILNPTLGCNFKCWYCYENHIKNSKMSKEIQERILKHIENKINKGDINGLHLSWFGGEPLLCFEDIIYPISRKAKEIMENNNLGFRNRITTNGYLLSEDMIDKIKEIELFNYQITLDGGQKRHDKSRILKNGDPTFKRIIENIKLLCKHLPQVNITLRINYTDELKKEEIKEILSNLKNDSEKSKIKISFQRIWQTYKNKNSNSKEYKKFNLFDIIRLCIEEGFIIEDIFTIGYGNKCYADRWNEAVINYNGDVYKCTARDFTKENCDGYLKEDGNIQWIPEKIFKRFGQTFPERCLNCKLLPACLGPCSQYMMETKDVNKICMLDNMDINIEEFVLIYYYQKIKESQKKKEEKKSINKVS